MEDLDRTRWMRDAVAWAREQLDFDADETQALVLRSKAKRGILCCSRQWGKSTVSAIKALHRAWFKDKSLVIVASPSERQSAEFLRKVRAFASKLGVKMRSDGQNRTSLVLDNGSRLVGLPDNEEKVRGFSGVSLLVIDEASRVPEDSYRALRPMLAASDGDLWLMSTPFGRRGFFWEEWMRRNPEWERVEARAQDCPRITAEFLADERNTLGERWFAQEYECEFAGVDDNVFNSDLLDAMVDQDEKELRL